MTTVGSRLAAPLVRARAVPVRSVAVLAGVVWLVAALFYGVAGWRGHWFLDLDIYRAAGASLYHGGQPFHELFMRPQLPFTYPPFALLVLSPLSLLPLPLAQVVWWLASCAALVGAMVVLFQAASDPLPARAASVPAPVAASARALAPASAPVAASAPVVGGGVAGGAPGSVAGGVATTRPFHFASQRHLVAWAALTAGLATLLLEPVRSSLSYGQINLFLLLVVVVDCTGTTQTRWRGCLVGLAAAIKLTPLVFLAAFLVARDWRSLARGAGTFVVATAVSWLVLPSASTAYWFHQVANARRTGPLGQIRNQSWYGLLHRAPFHWGHAADVAWVLLVAVTAAAGLALAWLLARTGRKVEVVLVLALVGLLVSPVSWTHHWSMVVVAIVVAPSLHPTRPGVARLVAGLLVLTVAAPYWWLPWGFIRPLSHNLLVLAAVVVLAWWLPVEWAAWRRSRTGAGLGLRGGPATFAGVRAGTGTGAPAD